MYFQCLEILLINGKIAERYLEEILSDNEIGEVDISELGDNEQAEMHTLSKKMLKITKAYLFGYCSLEKFTTELKKILNIQENLTEV